MTEQKTLMVLGQKQIADALADEQLCDKLLKEIKVHAESFTFDFSTLKGRKACISHAADVKRTGKALIEAADYETNKYKDEIEKLKGFKAKVKDYLAALSAEIRKPVTEIEEKEKLEKEKEEKRIALIQERIEVIKEFPGSDIALHSLSANVLETRIRELNDLVLLADLYQDFLEQAQEAKTQRLEELQSLFDFRKEQDVLAAEKKRLADQQAAIEKEKAELKAKEDARLKRIDYAIKRIQDCGWSYDQWINAPLVKDKIKTLEGIVVDESYEERFKEAESLKEDILHKLTAGLSLAVVADAETKSRLKVAEKTNAEKKAAEERAAEELKRKEVLAAENLEEEARKANIEHQRTINRKVVEILQSAGLDKEKSIDVLKAIIKANSAYITINY